MKTKSIIYILVIVVAIVIVFFAVLDSNRRDYKLHDNVNNNTTPVATTTKPVAHKLNATIPNVNDYDSIAVLKEGSDLFVLVFNTWESEYMGGTVYRVNTLTDAVTKLDASFIARENGLIVGVKAYPVGEIEKGNTLVPDDAKLTAVSQQTGIAKANLVVHAIGGKPSNFVFVKNVYNKGSNSMILTANQTSYPVYSTQKRALEWGGKVFPGTDYLTVTAQFDGTNPDILGGYTFTYSVITQTLNIK